MTKITFPGIGMMGAPMATNLIATGFVVTAGSDRTIFAKAARMTDDDLSHAEVPQFSSKT